MLVEVDLMKLLFQEFLPVVEVVELQQLEVTLLQVQAEMEVQVHLIQF
jgi:hypothetical protein